MEVEFNEDYSGSYKILILLDQDAQFYALETGQTTAIGGLDAILSDLPEGYGSSIYQEGNYLGILVRNDFSSFTYYSLRCIISFNYFLYSCLLFHFIRLILCFLFFMFIQIIFIYSIISILYSSVIFRTTDFFFF